LRTLAGEHEDDATAGHLLLFQGCAFLFLSLVDLRRIFVEHCNVPLDCREPATFMRLSRKIVYRKKNNLMLFRSKIVVANISRDRSNAGV
jgi:hypothetical protein